MLGFLALLFSIEAFGVSLRSSRLICLWSAGEVNSLPLNPTPETVKPNVGT